MVAIQNSPRNFQDSRPSTPNDRFAKATSSWNGLPVGHSIYVAIISSIKACPRKAHSKPSPTCTVRIKRRAISANFSESRMICYDKIDQKW